ncbi:MAG: radical SAM protein [Candidatus Zixiibacteriota bacterium]|nr:MAG: radical SAM protein [candidate division Zixibacteria bacterium]
MKIKKIVGIEPAPPGFHVFSAFKLPRLGLPMMGTILRDKGYRVRLFCQDLAPVDWEETLSADLVMISTITSTAPEAYDIAKKIKEKARVLGRDITVVMGGAHVTFMAEEALDNYADFVVRGEGEETILELAAWLENGNDATSVSRIPGLSYKIGTRVYHNERRSYLRNQDSLPTPELSLIKGWKEPGIFPVLSSRGCPFDCTFCSVTKMFGHKYRVRSPEKVLEDIRYYHRLYPKAWMFFYDDNFAADKKRTKRLLRLMVENDMIFPWTAQSRLDVVKDRELLQLMHRAGCKVLYIGLESVNPQTLLEYKKRQTVDEMGEAIKILHQYKIKTHGMFVLGGEQDDRETVMQTVRSAIKWKIDTAQMVILTPLPGTPLYDKLVSENRVTSFDWSQYDGHHVVYKPNKMSVWELQFGVMLEAMPKFYSLWQVIKAGVRFKYKNFIFRAYGHWMLIRWKVHNSRYLEELKAFSSKLISKEKPKQLAEGRKP